MESAWGNDRMLSLRVIRCLPVSGGILIDAGSGGAAVHSLIERDLAPLLQGADPRHVEELWERMWWHLHFVDRGGIAAFAMAAVDIALWDMRALEFCRVA